MTDQLQQVPLAKIVPSPDNPRKHFDPEGLQELAASLKAVGVVEPIILRPDGERYVLVAGERRFRAAKLAGLKELPAVIREYQANVAIGARLVENIQREDLTATEKAAAYRDHLALTGGTQKDLAAILGKTEAHVSQVLAVLALPRDAQALVNRGQLGLKHARELNRLKDHPKRLAEVVGSIKEDAGYGELWDAGRVKDAVDGELADAAAEKQAAAAAEKAKKAGRPAPTLTPEQLADRRRQRTLTKLARARNRVIDQLAPEIIREALKRLGPVQLPDRYVGILAPQSFYGAAKPTRYLTDLAPRVVYRMPGKWAKPKAGSRAQPRFAEARDVKAERSWLAFYLWVELDSREWDPRLDQAARDAIAKADKAPKAGKAKPAAKGGKR